jgi:pyruvate,water dikinase
LLVAIRQCWASYWNEEAAFYRDQFGVDHTEHTMSVLVQRMVPSKFAGVIFTRTPLQQGDSPLLLEAVAGNGDALVSGDARPARYIIVRDSRQQTNQADLSLGMDASMLEDLVALGLAVEKHQGSPQDIEWCVDESDHVWILQTRPIADASNAEPISDVDDLTKFLRMYDEPFSTLGCDLALRRYERWVEARNDYCKTTFKPKTKVVNGFLHYNPLWRSPSRPLRLRMRFWKILRWFQAERIYREYTERVLPEHLKRIAEIDERDVFSLDSTALLRYFDSAIEAYLDIQQASYPVIEIAIASGEILDQLCRLWFKNDATMRVANFLCGLDNLTVDHDLALHHLGQVLRETLMPDEIAKLDYSTLLSLKTRGTSVQNFGTELQSFLNRYGYIWADRYPRDPAWQLNNLAVVSSLTRAAQVSDGGGLPAMHAKQSQRRANAIVEADQWFSTHRLPPFRKTLFGWCLHRAERFFPHKEDRNHHVYQSMMVIRKFAQEIGRRLSACHLLETPQDVFFLTWDEIREAMTDTIKAADFMDQVRERQHIYYRSRQEVLCRKPGNQLAGKQPIDGDASTIELVGEAGSPGIAVGPARLVNGLSDLHRIQSGDVVVCRTIRPAWSTVFAKAAGVVVETGGLLSHGATLAREYGVPAVLNVAGATHIVVEGDTLRVDGYRGIVVKDN